MKRILFVLLILVACNTNNSKNKLALTKQDGFPEIGKPMPDFELKNIQNYDKQNASLEDFNGKWLILDFWTRYCTNCLRSFPKVDKLRKEFKEDVVFMLVGRNDGPYYQGTEKIFKKVEKKYHLNLPVVYQVGLFDSFGVVSVPHIIWIDPKGIVRAITTSTDLTSENIKQFLVGKIPDFPKALNSKEEEEKKAAYDFRKPLLVDGNGGNSTDFLYRSILTGMNREVYGSVYSSYFLPSDEELAGFSAVNISLKNLYFAAYGDTISPNPGIIRRNNNYGKWWYTPLLEVKDSTLFKPDFKTGKGIYCYELNVPESKRSNTLYRQRMVQKDLKNYFGHKVTVETKIMPYWKVLANEDTRINLQTQGGEESISGGGLTKIVLTNQPMKRLISIMWGLYQQGPPFIDETGIKGNIDITLEGILTDFEDFKKALENNGLKLEKGEKKMKVIVIRDPVVD